MTPEILRSLLLSIQGKNIILPSATVAEIIRLDKITPMPDAPEWVLGLLSWQGIAVPLIRFEEVRAHQVWAVSALKIDLPVQNAYVAIIHRLDKPRVIAEKRVKMYPFFSILLDSSPKLVQLKAGEIQAVRDIEQDIHYLMEVKIEQEQVFIPNLASVWEMIDNLPSRFQRFQKISLE